MRTRGMSAIDVAIEMKFPGMKIRITRTRGRKGIRTTRVGKIKSPKRKP